MIQHVRRATATIAASAALTMALAGCGGDEPDPIPSTSPSTSASPSQSPSTDPDAWKTKYNAKQVAAYDAALQRFEDYESRSEPIWAKGEATPQAEKLFREYWPSPGWMRPWQVLQGYEQVGVKISGTPSVYWSRAKTVNPTSTRVEIDQCVDYGTVSITQRGKAIKREDPKPQLRTIHLYTAKGYDWLIDRIIESTEEDFRPCTP